MSAIKLALLGFGTVNSGFYKRLMLAEEKIYKDTGYKAEVVKILVQNQDLDRIPKHLHPLLTLDPDSILNNPEIQVVVEAINGPEPAGEYLQRALESGKHVISANKAALARRWESLQSAAYKNGVKLYCEASVCAGIPLISVIDTIKTSDQITSIEGIVNGTSNYILTSMCENGTSFDKSLKEAQKYGFVEADPSSDVDGIDAANKLSILCSLAFDKSIDPIGIKRDSIRGLIEGRPGLKLIAKASYEGNRLKAEVVLEELSSEHPLYGVNGVDNGIIINTEGVGQIKLFGPGAGSDPTGTAMVSDFLLLTRALKKSLN